MRLHHESSVIRLGVERKILKFRLRVNEPELSSSRWAVSLLSDDDLSYSWLFAGLFGLVLIAVDEHDEICILLNGTRLAKIAHHGAFISSLLNPSIELRQRNYRASQLFCKHLHSA